MTPDVTAVPPVLLRPASNSRCRSTRRTFSGCRERRHQKTWLPLLRLLALAARPAEAQPESPPDVGAHAPTCRALPTYRLHHALLCQGAIPLQHLTQEPSALVHSARSDPCGGAGQPASLP